MEFVLLIIAGAVVYYLYISLQEYLKNPLKQRDQEEKISNFNDPYEVLQPESLQEKYLTTELGAMQAVILSIPNCKKEYLRPSQMFEELIFKLEEKYLCNIETYKDFKDRYALLEEKLSAEEMVRRATKYKIGGFTKQDIIELCPTLSMSSIELSLRKLVKSGELKREGQSKSISYYRLD